MTHRSRQLDLMAPSLDVGPACKAAMRDAYRASGLSVEQVCDRMNEAAACWGVALASGRGARLTSTTLEKWLQPAEREHSVPLVGLVIFCRVLGTLAPLGTLVAPLQARVIDERQARLLRLAEIEDEERRLKREKRRLQAGL